jgi:hypothetical protein
MKAGGLATSSSDLTAKYIPAFITLTTASGQLAGAATSVGAFALASGSALIVNPSANAHTMQLSDVSNLTGEALAEACETS